jgi:hypothetical protein
VKVELLYFSLAVEAQQSLFRFHYRKHMIQKGLRVRHIRNQNRAIQCINVFYLFCQQVLLELIQSLGIELMVIHIMLLLVCYLPVTTFLLLCLSIKEQ